MEDRYFQTIYLKDFKKIIEVEQKLIKKGININPIIGLNYEDKNKSTRNGHTLIEKATILFNDNAPKPLYEEVDFVEFKITKNVEFDDLILNQEEHQKLETDILLYEEVNLDYINTLIKISNLEQSFFDKLISDFLNIVGSEELSISHHNYNFLFDNKLGFFFQKIGCTPLSLQRQLYLIFINVIKSPPIFNLMIDNEGQIANEFLFFTPRANSYSYTMFIKDKIEKKLIQAMVKNGIENNVINSAFDEYQHRVGTHIQEYATARELNYSNINVKIKELNKIDK